MPQTATDEQKTKAILKKVRQIEIRTRRLVTDAMAGAYHSSFRGQGMNFEEVREYMPGDDVRSIDWNVTAKMQKPFVKIFREERELTLMLAVDLSASGAFGSNEQSKRELAAEIASVLAFSAVRNNDKVGVILFTDKIEEFIAPQKGRQHALRMIRDILFFTPRNKGTDIPHALDYMNRILKRKAVCFLISDFIENESPKSAKGKLLPQETLIKKLALTNNRHDLICLNLSDPRELELPNIGIVTLEDAESGEFIEINTSIKRVRDEFNKNNKQRRENFMKSMNQNGIDCIQISTEESYIHTLKRFFERRAQRR